MNLAPLRIVAQAIEDERAGAVDNGLAFDMGQWGYKIGYDPDFMTYGHCKTACCIAGHLVHLLSPGVVRANPTGKAIKLEACRLLGIEDVWGVVAAELFEPNGLDRLTDDPRVPDALRWMAEFGVVDWGAALDAVDHMEVGK